VEFKAGGGGVGKGEDLGFSAIDPLGLALRLAAKSAQSFFGKERAVSSTLCADDLETCGTAFREAGSVSVAFTAGGCREGIEEGLGFSATGSLGLA